MLRLPGLPNRLSSPDRPFNDSPNKELRGVPKSVAAGLAVVLLGLGPLGTALAQDLDEGQSVSLGESDLYPSLVIEYLANDNAFLLPENEEESSDVSVRPSLFWRADRRGLSLEALYSGSYQTSDVDAREFADHFLSFTSAAVLGKRQRVTGTLSFERGHEDVGSGLLRGAGDDFDEPITFNELVGEGAFTFGAEAARGNAELGLRLESFSYDSFDNAAGNDITDGRDFTLVQPTGTFSLRISPDTRALLGLQIGSFDFDNDNRDRVDYTLFTGLSFSPTGAVSGGLRLGATTAVFSELDRDDQTSFTASANLTYVPVSFSRFTLVYTRDFDNRTSTVPDPDDPAVDVTEDVLVVDDNIRLDWRYDWSSRFRHRAFVQRTGDDRVCPERDSATVSAGINLGLQVRRWMEIGAGIQSDRRDADNCTGNDGEELEYDRQIVNAFARFTL